VRTGAGEQDAVVDGVIKRMLYSDDIIGRAKLSVLSLHLIISEAYTPHCQNTIV
jgi:hypothetical protein